MLLKIMKHFVDICGFALQLIQCFPQNDSVTVVGLLFLFVHVHVPHKNTFPLGDTVLYARKLKVLYWSHIQLTVKLSLRI